MTQEQIAQAKAYVEALNRAKEIYSKDDVDPRCKGVIGDLFPEIRETEDDRIRKAIINVFATHKYYEIFFGVSVEDILAWLETEDKIDEDLMAKKFLINKGYPIDANGTLPTYEELYNIIREGLEKQGGQKQTDKTEPKFREGDWIVQKGLGTYKIVEICESWYEVISYKDGIQYSIGFDKENDCHLWTIDDAKDGDVLCDYHEAFNNPLIFILKKFEHVNFGLVKPSDYSSYCFLTSGDRQRFKEGTYHHEHNIKPATKEQRDLLFTKMNEALYEWDAEKKELKRIEKDEEVTCSCLWTIDDAENGDVLVYPDGSLSIFRYRLKGLDAGLYMAHVVLTDKIETKQTCTIKDVKPATKKQCNTLFQKMKEAGYEWDADKKELKKIEDEEYNGEDYGIDSLYHAQRILEKTLGSVDGYQTDDGILSHKCAITAIKKLYEQKPTEWNEEDERNLQGIIDEIQANKNNAPDYDLKTYDSFLDWLKSLRQRMGE